MHKTNQILFQYKEMLTKKFKTIFVKLKEIAACKRNTADIQCAKVVKKSYKNGVEAIIAQGR